MSQYSTEEKRQPVLETDLAALGSSVDLGQWDTVFAVKMDVLNDIIVAQPSHLTTFAQSNKFTGSISGTWGPWQLVPDAQMSGKDLKLKCTIASGTGTDITGASYKLDGAIVYLNVNLRKVPTPNLNLKDQTGIAGTGTVSSLFLATTDQGNQPPVWGTILVPATLNGSLAQIFQEWFLANMSDFDALFHSAILNVQVDQATQGNFQWVKPTDYSYAALTNAANVGLFGVQSVCSNQSITQLPAQIPGGLLDNMPDDANSVFAISSENFCRHFLLAGAVSTMPGSQPSDFEISADGLTVSNTRALNWIDLDFSGNTVTPSIPAGGMKMYVEEDQIILDFEGLTWDHAFVLSIMGGDTFEMSFRQAVYLDLQWKNKTEPVFVTSNAPPGTKSSKRQLPKMSGVTIKVTPNKTAVKMQNIVHIVMMCFTVVAATGAFAGGLEWVSNGLKVTGDADAAAADMVATGRDVLELGVREADEAGQAAVPDSEIDAGNQEGLNVSKGNTKSITARNVGYVTRFAMLGALTGFGLQEWSGLKMKSDSTKNGNDIDPNSLDSMLHFVDNIVGAAHWPDLPNWKLSHATLAQSLLLYGTLSK